MTISQVALSNTFNEFRSTFNDAANTVNSFTVGTGAISANTITLSALTSGRVPLVSTAGLIVDDSNLTYDTSTDILTLGGSITLGTLTSGRVPLVSTAGLIVDDSNLTYNTSTDVLTLGGSTDASSTTTGTLVVTGGVGVAKKLYVGTDLNVTGNTVSSTVTANNLTSGRVVLSGTAGQILDDSALTYNTSTDILTLAGTTDATTSTDGTLVVSGGVGVAKKLYVGTDLSVAGDATFTGNVIILGSNSEISTTQINVNDPLIQLANNNTSNTVDIGLFGQYNPGSANVYSGLFRDASDGIWKFFKDYTVEPGTTIDPAANGFSYANVSIGALSTANNISIGTGQAYQINGANVLSSTVLGSTVVTSSLTTVGTIGSGVWQGTVITPTYGGTGLSTLTANSVIIGNGTSNPTFVAPSSNGNILTSNGTNWISSAPAASTGVTTGKAIAMALVFGG